MVLQYFGKHTKKAQSNFPFSFRQTPKELIHAIAEIKKASAIAHSKVGELDSIRKQAIALAADEVISGKLDNQFSLPAFQGGAGTSNHMNVNEVIAGRATQLLVKRGKHIGVHPNDHVNMSASTNDVMPSALRIVAFRLIKNVVSSVDELVDALEKNSRNFRNILKLGRTHLQDAVPVTLGSEFTAYAENIKLSRDRLRNSAISLLRLNLGGTAAGNSVNASKKYVKNLYQELRKVTKLPVLPARNLMALTSNNADFVDVSQSLTLLCLELSKIANDLRLLGSGPKGGLGEIILPQLQPGSSIMPGKVNPVLPEAVNQLFFLVSGNNLTIEYAAHAAQLQLGAMLPILTDRLIESLKISSELISIFARKCVVGIKANKNRCKENLERSTAYATLLSPKLGYDAVGNLVQESVAKNMTIRQLVLEKKLLSNKQFDSLVSNFIRSIS